MTQSEHVLLLMQHAQNVRFLSHGKGRLGVGVGAEAAGPVKSVEIIDGSALRAASLYNHSMNGRRRSRSRRSRSRSRSQIIF